jgi:hypothetical protein
LLRESPLISDLVISSIIEATAAEAPALDKPVSLATLAMSSCLFNQLARLRLDLNQLVRT